MASEEQVASLVIGGRRLTANEYIVQAGDAVTLGVKTLVEQMAVELIDELERNAPVGSTGALSSGVRLGSIETTEEGVRLILTFSAPYTDFVDKGVRGIRNKATTYPNSEGRYYQFTKYGAPIEAINSLREWMRKKNMDMEATAKINKDSGKKRMFSPEQSAAISLMRAIKTKGISGKQFKKKSISIVQEKYKSKLAEVGQNAFVLKIPK